MIGFAGEISTDGFCGGGGASCGMELALGRCVDEALNHSPRAIAMHERNHPGTRHHCQDIRKKDPLEVTQGRPVGLSWFSPDCTHHSRAKGGKPRSKGMRDLAWVVNHWAWRTRPRIIMVENVQELLSWGPLDEKGQPIPERRGEYFQDWVADLRCAGYRVEWRIIRACDFGAPTYRERLFIIARRDGRPIVWPEPTHGPGLIPYRQAWECIDWSQPMRSIFDPSRAKPLVDATMARIARGVNRFVLNDPEPFLVKYHGGGDSDCRSYSLHEPLRTLDTSNRFALIAPFFVPRYGERPGQDPRCQPVTTPLSTIVPTANGAQLVACFMAQHNGGATGHSLREPLSTITGRACQQQLVSAFLIKYYRTGTARPLTEPLDTITSDDRFGLVNVYGQDYVITDIAMRMLAPRELFRAQGFPESYVIDPEFDGRPLSKTAQVECCGNSVCPPVVEALVRANVTLRGPSARRGRPRWTPLFGDEAQAC